MSIPKIVEPSACTWCGIEQRGHGRQYADAAGWHAWERPSQEQILARMHARRLARFVAREGALPMPVGPKPVVAAPLALSEEQIEALAAAGDLVVNNAVHEDLCGCDAWPEKCVSTSHYYMGAWDVNGLEDALPAVLALWEQMRGGELERLRARVAELEAGRRADHATWQHDLRTARSEREASAVRIAELESERHSTNEALDDAVQELRARAGRSADKLTRLFAPVQALREDPHDGPLHHSYRVGRDLPEPGGA